MEEKIAKWTSGLLGGSYIVFALIFLSFMAVPKLLSGEILDDPFFLKALVIAVMYIISIYLVATLPGKTKRRRVVSWCISIGFHSSLLIYLGVFNEWGTTIFIIGMVETIILLLSTIGLCLLIYDSYKYENA